MPRVSKRKSQAPNPPPAKSSKIDSNHSAPNRVPSKEVDRIDNFFGSYANKLLGMIDPEGVEALCSDLCVDHTDVRILMLAWKMNAKKQGYFTQDEWQTGLKALHVSGLKKLKNALSELEKELRDPKTFEDFYCYAFRYCLTENNQKTLDIESICILLDLVLGSQFRLQVDSFSKYLRIQTDYKVLNMDQWINILRFCNEISFPDLNGYDSCQAWPCILDNFVDWMREKNT